MPVNDELLEILCCPVSRTPVRRMSREELDRLNEAVRAGRASHVDQSAVEEELEEGLITVDGRMIYAVDAGIPVMLEEKGIPAGTLE